jgi:hypothetical protein
MLILFQTSQEVLLLQSQQLPCNWKQVRVSCTADILSSNSKSIALLQAQQLKCNWKMYRIGFTAAIVPSNSARIACTADVETLKV